MLRFFIAGCFASYVVWLAAFGFYRYLAPLELLAPLLIAALVFEATTTPATLLALAVVLGVGVLPLREARARWQADYFGVVVPPVVAGSDPQALVLLGGAAPVAFVLPQLPNTQRFVRIQSNFMGRASGIDAYARDLVAAHAGALFALAASAEITDMDP